MFHHIPGNSVFLLRQLFAESMSRRITGPVESRQSGLEARIRNFRLLADNWDGDGAGKIPNATIREALMFLEGFRQQFSGREPDGAAPASDGGIALYWHGPSGYAEISFNGSGLVSMCRIDNTDHKEGQSENVEIIEEKIEDIFRSGPGRIKTVLVGFSEFCPDWT